MPGATPSYPPEFKREAVRLVRSSPNRSVAQRIARDLGWYCPAFADGFPLSHSRSLHSSLLVLQRAHLS